MVLAIATSCLSFNLFQIEEVFAEMFAGIKCIELNKFVCWMLSDVILLVGFSLGFCFDCELHFTADSPCEFEIWCHLMF